MTSIFIDVEEGANCPYSLQLLFSALDEARAVRGVRLYHESADGALYDVVAWNNESDKEGEALGAPVEDSGQARAYLIFGGTAGIRLRPASSMNMEPGYQRSVGQVHMVCRRPKTSSGVAPVRESARRNFLAS
jgi:hypothetical protein